MEAPSVSLPPKFATIVNSYDPQKVSQGILVAQKAIQQSLVSQQNLNLLKNLVEKRIAALSNIETVVSLLGDFEDYLDDRLGTKKNKREDLKRKASFSKAQKSQKMQS